MLITTLTVAWNAVATIADTCRSVAAQRHPAVEHLVIDGASRDNTVGVARAHLRAGGRIVSEPDRGLYDAMNKGLAQATGEIVGFLNADDVFADDLVLSRIASTFADPMVDAVFGDLVYVAANDLTRVVRYWDAGSFRPRAFRYGIMPPHPTLYVRHSLLPRIGGFRLDLSMANDFECCLRWLSTHRLRVRHIPQVLVCMRLGGESNRSWRNVFRQNACIQQALRWNNMAPHPLFPVLKILIKGRQYVTAWKIRGRHK